jgi:hypothetical protein
MNIAGEPLETLCGSPCGSTTMSPAASGRSAMPSIRTNASPSVTK